MTAYKLFRKRANGTLGSLFIHKTAVIPIGQWLEAEDHQTRGYAHRPGWHCTPLPYAPHLRQGGDRVWCEVEIKDISIFKRPERQGGAWLLAGKMKVIQEAASGGAAPR